MKKKLIISTLAVLALAVTGYVEFLRGNTHAYDFRLDKVSQGDLTVFVTATGTISAVISVDVGTQVSGIITNLYADFNSEVKAGDMIAKLDTTFLYQSLTDAEASLERAQVQLNDSRRNLAREKDLVERGLDAQMSLDTAIMANASNEAGLKSAQAALDEAKINLGYATITAPISGIIVDRPVNVGQTVASSFSSPTLFTIANDLKRMQVQTTVDESDVGRVSVGQEASFTVDAYPDDQFKGTVSQIRLAPQSIQNVVSYVVVIDVLNDQLKLMPGMTANVKITAASATGTLKVSNMALRFQPPADLVDTAGATGMRGGFSGRGEGRRDSSVMEQKPVVPGGGGGVVATTSSTTRQAQTSAALKTKTIASADAAKFGIDSKFPEYQKSAYIPSHQSGRGRVWILKSNGKLEPVFVQTGLNDGRYTEITSQRLKAGDQIVLGATSLADALETVAPSPLSGQSQQRPMGGGGR